MLIKVLGSGCKKCIALTENVQAAARTAGLDVQIEKITDIVEIAGYGVMSTPGLVIDDKVVSTGRVPTTQEIGEMLST